jgi:hypothetical protein
VALFLAPWYGGALAVDGAVDGTSGKFQDIQCSDGRTHECITLSLCPCALKGKQIDAGGDYSYVVADKIGRSHLDY